MKKWLFSFLACSLSACQPNSTSLNPNQNTDNQIEKKAEQNNFKNPKSEQTLSLSNKDEEDNFSNNREPSAELATMLPFSALDSQKDPKRVQMALELANKLLFQTATTENAKNLAKSVENFSQTPTPENAQKALEEVFSVLKNAQKTTKSDSSHFKNQGDFERESGERTQE